METKYYIPIIEEFNTDFEFQYLDISGTWINVTKDNWLSPRKMYTIYENVDYNYKETEVDLLRNLNILDVNLKRNDRIRVKYLDSNDLLELGFKEGLINMGGLEDQVVYKLNHFIITSAMNNYIKKDNSFILDISIMSEFESIGLQRIFRGSIKNKSELKKLMKQLGIYE